MKDDLGDGVSVEYTGSMYRIYTERDGGVHEIYLERQALIRLWLFVSRVDAAEDAAVAVGVKGPET
jgi:hypothetical protein